MPRFHTKYALVGKGAESFAIPGPNVMADHIADAEDEALDVLARSLPPGEPVRIVSIEEVPTYAKAFIEEEEV